MLAASIVAPGHSRVIPLMPEFVANHDGAAKQDCERNAAKRWHGRHGKRLKALRPVCLGDDAREASHKVLCEFISGALLQRHAGVERKGKTRKTLNYRWIEDAPLRDGEDAITVTWIGFDIADDKGRSLCSTALVTSLAAVRCRIRAKTH